MGIKASKKQKQKQELSEKQKQELDKRILKKYKINKELDKLFDEIYTELYTENFCGLLRQIRGKYDTDEDNFDVFFSYKGSGKFFHCGMWVNGDKELKNQFNPNPNEIRTINEFEKLLRIREKYKNYVYLHKKRNNWYENYWSEGIGEDISLLHIYALELKLLRK